MKYIEVGKIVNTHGIKGEVKIQSYTELDRFAKGHVLFIGDELKEVKVKTRRIDKGFEFVCFEGYEDINLVLPFKGKLIKIKETDLGEKEEDEYFVSELIGMEVYNEDNLYRGIVTGIREVPQGELLEVKGEKKTALIPFRKEFIVDVSDRIIIHEIEGLI